MLIERPDGAARLARALVADLLLYNRALIEAGGDVSGAVEEARALFVARVAPGLDRLFDDALGDQPPLAAYARGGAGHTPPPGPGAPPVAPGYGAPPGMFGYGAPRGMFGDGAPPGMFGNGPRPVAPARTVSKIVPVLFVAALLFGVAMFFFLLRR